MIYPNLEFRIWANSADSLTRFFNGTPCREWLGKLNHSGYPQMTIRKRGRKNPVPVFVHRIVLKVCKGENLPRTRIAMHQCDNPACIAPDHLKPGSQSMNMTQCVERGRHNSVRRAQ